MRSFTSACDSPSRAIEASAPADVGIAPGRAAFMFPTDETLLQRVLGNLLKNALEASQPGDTVELALDTTKLQVFDAGTGANLAAWAG